MTALSMNIGASQKLAVEIPIPRFSSGVAEWEDRGSGLINQLGVDACQTHDFDWSHYVEESRAHLRGLIWGVLISGVLWAGIIAGVSKLMVGLR
jgi:hypothetical protein